MPDYSNPSQQTPKPAGNSTVGQTGGAPNQKPSSWTPNNNQNNGSAKTLKTIAIVLGLALAVCVGILVYMMINNNKNIETISLVTTEKEKVTSDLMQLRSEYSDLQTNNDTINAQLDREKQKIDLLLEQIKKTDARNKSNLNKIKQYEQEMGSLRTVLRGYVRQIDSLNNLNLQLRNENKEVKQRAEQAETRVSELTQRTEDLTSKVQKGAVISARDVMVSAINSRGKGVTRAGQVDKIRTCLTLTSNSIAEKGIRTLYVRISGPDGSLLTDSPNNLFNKEDGSQLIYSAMREIDYQGDDLEVCVFYSDKDCVKGMYNVEVYMGGVLIGTSQLLLK